MIKKMSEVIFMRNKGMMGTIISILTLLCVTVSVILVFGVMARFYETGRWLMFLGGAVALCFLMSLLINSATVLMRR